MKAIEFSVGRGLDPRSIMPLTVLSTVALLSILCVRHTSMVSYFKAYGRVQQSALNRGGSDNLHESKVGSVLKHCGFGRIVTPMTVCNCV
jgi:hypothetical protein